MKLVRIENGFYTFENGETVHKDNPGRIHYLRNAPLSTPTETKIEVPEIKFFKPKRGQKKPCGCPE